MEVGAKHNFFIFIESYIQYSISDKKKIDKGIDILYREYEDKKRNITESC